MTAKLKSQDNSRTFDSGKFKDMHIHICTDMYRHAHLAIRVYFHIFCSIFLVGSTHGKHGVANHILWHGSIDVHGHEEMGEK